MTDFFNTTKEKGQQLELYQKKATAQKLKILKVFRDHPGELLTPFQVQTKAEMLSTPITSIRRSMTSLTKSCHLEKTDTTKKEKLGRPNCCWRLNIETEMAKNGVKASNITKHREECPKCYKYVEYTVELLKNGVKLKINKCKECGHQVMSLSEF